ncbi:hypothetical protein [Spirillospora sp. CA-294931]|uniref:hypothetical protein n=1 Tax=Spirillospora sp. CA-294931 TaxID=3240042 RepID=UPI003D9372F8
MNRIAVLATGTAAVLAGSGFAAVHAEERARDAAPSIVSIAVDPATVVLTGRAERRFTITVVAGGARHVRAQVNQAGHGGGTVTSLRPTGRPNTWTGFGTVNWVDAPGAYSVRVTALDENADTAEGSRGFQVRRGTYFKGFAGSPATVRRGRAITVAGQLKGLNYAGDWAAYQKGAVILYFRKAGTRAWVRYATVTTGRDGRFVKRFTARSTGDWGAQFRGNGSWAGSSSKASRVRVR